MRHVFALLLAFTVTVAVALAPAFSQEDGPAVCQYRDGTTLNVWRGNCTQPPWFDQR